MQKLIIYFIFSFVAVIANAQMPTNGDYSNWNWEDQSENNWKRRTETIDPSSPDKHEWKYIRPPFNSIGGRVDLMSDIWKYSDYTKAKGWDLLWANFYEQYPYYILYNKYRGLIRVFFFRTIAGNEEFKDFAVTLSFKGKKSALFSFGNEYKQATDKYLSDVSTGDDILTTVIPVVTIGEWGCAQFTILFDDNIIKENCSALPANPYAGSRLKVLVFGVTDFNVTLEGTIVNVDPKGTSIQGGTYNGLNSIETTNATLIKELKSMTDMVSSIKLSYSDINVKSDSTPKYLKFYRNTLEPVMSDFSKVLKVTSGISNTIGVAFSLYNSVLGLMGEAPNSTPVTTTSTVKLAGSMTTQAPLTGEEFKVPGACIDQYQNIIPYYDCSMGLINLSKTPKIKATKTYYRVPTIPSIATCTGFWFDKGQPGLKYIKYKFNDDIKLVVNNMSGVEIVDKKFAIVCKANDNTPPAYPVVFKADFCFEASAIQIREFSNPIWQSLELGRFILHKRDTENPKNNLFGSPYMNAEKLKGFSFEVHDYTEVYLGVIVQLKVPNYTDYLFVKALYKLDKEVVADAVTDPILNNDEQPVFPLSDYYKCNIRFDLNKPNNSSTYTAELIKLNPGFVGITNFSAHSCDPYPTGPELVPEYVPFICRDYRSLLKSGRILDENTIGGKTLMDSDDCIIYPNPTDGRFTIEVKGSSSQSARLIGIMNSMGIEIQLNSVLEGVNKITVDLTGNVQGIYFVKLNLNGKIQIKKIIYK